MKAKVLSMVLIVVLIMGLILSGCSNNQNQRDELEHQILVLQTEKAETIAEKELIEIERNKLKSDLENKIIELNNKDNQITEILNLRDAEIIKSKEKEKEFQLLQLELDYLSNPIPDISLKIAGRATFEELILLAREFFPKAARTTSYIKTSCPLADLETLEKFLEEDSTNHIPEILMNHYNALDELAFRLKDRWIKAGLPPYSLGLIKGERMVNGIKQMGWRNIFITVENNELVIYEVWAFLDKIEKIEEPNLETYRVIVRDTI